MLNDASATQARMAGKNTITSRDSREVFNLDRPPTLGVRNLLPLVQKLIIEENLNSRTDGRCIERKRNLGGPESRKDRVGQWTGIQGKRNGGKVSALLCGPNPVSGFSILAQKRISLRDTVCRG